MSFLNCPECSHKISDQDELCPQCGLAIAKINIGSNSYHIFKKQIIKYLLVLFATLIILLCWAVYSNFIKRQQEALKQQQDIAQKRNWFNSAKTLIKTNTLLDEELGKAKASLESVDSSMPEYKEAQELLPSILSRLTAVEKANETKAENAKYTPGGKRVHENNPNWSPDVCNTIAKGQIYIGMTKEQVRAAWGRPYRVNTTTGSFGEHEQWVMHEMGRSYVYFENGICTTIQN
jgi:hypothetical protein